MKSHETAARMTLKQLDEIDAREEFASTEMADVKDLTAEVRLLLVERDALAKAIADAAMEACIYNGEAALTWPMLIQLAQDLGRRRIGRQIYPATDEEPVKLTRALEDIR